MIGRKRFLTLSLAVLFFAPFWLQHAACADGPDRAPVFFQSLEDVPVMPGLAELPEQSLVFDKPDGRIAESVAAAGRLTENDIRTYYSGALPQLGWMPVGKDIFGRGTERLTVRFSRTGGRTLVYFMVEPR